MQHSQVPKTRGKTGMLPGAFQDRGRAHIFVQSLQYLTSRLRGKRRFDKRDIIIILRCEHCPNSSKKPATRSSGKRMTLDNTTGQTEKTATHRPRALSYGDHLWGRNTEPRSFEGPRRLPCKANASGKCQSLVSAIAMIRCATPAGKSTPSQWMSGVLVASCPVRHRPRQCGHAALESVRCHVDMCWSHSA